MDIKDIKIRILGLIYFCLQILKENPKLITLIVIFVSSLFVIQQIKYQIAVADGTTVHDTVSRQAEYNRGVSDSTTVHDAVSITVERAY